ncbi:MAG: DUF2721 domain-containing protein [Bacteroidota bacterium]|nr:DUF2721 domain-containing protein [Bacteroidota bacterium]
MDITTPALLFPAISLIMLAYTNRFMAVAGVIRTLHDRYKAHGSSTGTHAQILNLRHRLRLIKNMQILGVISFILTICCMFLIYSEKLQWARISFSAAILLFGCSLLLSLMEIIKSTKALELELSDMEGMGDDSFTSYFKKKPEKKKTDI